ncbi:MAG: glycosyl hydrolase family 18 protein [Lachnospiraceae bacterium]|nr:glycosyl hydrolase family 18 protein [Lachnospiraceae bacterium]
MNKKLIPIFVAIVLIIVVVAATFGADIIERFTYSDEVYDMKVYFENKSDEDVAIIWQDEFMQDRAYLIDGTYYVDLDFVHTYFNDRFYYDPVDSLLIYTLPTNMLMNKVGTNEIIDNDTPGTMEYVPSRLEGDKLLVALDYAKKFSNFSYEKFENPNRIQIYTKWEERQVGTIKKDTQVRHRGGIKEEILKELKAGDKVIVIDQMEEWSKVKTDDAIIGFVENKRIGSIVPETPLPVEDYKEPEYSNLCRDYKINMGWHAVAGVAGNDTLDQYVANTKGLNVISPTWFNLNDSEGNYDNFSTKAYVDRAHALGLEVWPTFNNVEHGSDVSMKKVLESTSKRLDLIDRLVSDMLMVGIDGINVDIEMLPTEAGRDFSEFIRELSIACRKNNLVLSIDNYVPLGNTDYYDRKTQGEVADYVVIMGYDEHYAGSKEAGSVASIGYVTAGIENTLEEVPPYKVINGIPFYTRIWDTVGVEMTSQAVDMQTAKDFLKRHNIEATWDDTTCQHYGEINEGGTLRQVWLEDADSIRAKLSVMSAHGLGGVAEWKLGLETPDVWDVILEYLNGTI